MDETRGVFITQKMNYERNDINMNDTNSPKTFPYWRMIFIIPVCGHKVRQISRVCSLCDMLRANGSLGSAYIKRLRT